MNLFSVVRVTLFSQARLRLGHTERVLSTHKSVNMTPRYSVGLCCTNDGYTDTAPALTVHNALMRLQNVLTLDVVFFSEQTKNLIELIRKHSCLYNTKDNSYL